MIGILMDYPLFAFKTSTTIMGNSISGQEKLITKLLSKMVTYFLLGQELQERPLVHIYGMVIKLF